MILLVVIVHLRCAIRAKWFQIMNWIHILFFLNPILGEHPLRMTWGDHSYTFMCCHPWEISHLTLIWSIRIIPTLLKPWLSLLRIDTFQNRWTVDSNSQHWMKMPRWHRKLRRCSISDSERYLFWVNPKSVSMLLLTFLVNKKKPLKKSVLGTWSKTCWGSLHGSSNRNSFWCLFWSLLDSFRS